MNEQKGNKYYHYQTSYQALHFVFINKNNRKTTEKAMCIRQERTRSDTENFEKNQGNYKNWGKYISLKSQFSA